jgi:hypothetical protein
VLKAEAATLPHKDISGWSKRTTAAESPQELRSGVNAVNIAAWCFCLAASFLHHLAAKWGHVSVHMSLT